MIDFMTLNGRAKGQWYDKIDTKDGIVTINFVDGHSDDNYKVLTGLREMIRLVTSQNLKDLRRKKYNTEMLKVIKTRHPNGVRGANSVVQNVIGTYNVPQYMTPEEIIEDRLDKAEENAQITLDNQKYVSNEQYEQAVTDVQDMINMKTKDLVR